MSDRDVVLRSLPPGVVPSAGIRRSLASTIEEQAELWDQFCVELEKLGGSVVLGSSLDDIAVSPLFADCELQIPESLTKADSVWQAETGVTLADCAIAETGTLLISTLTSPHRLASLATPLHIVLVQRSSIVRTLEEAFARYVPDCNSVFITGPSRTADIEGVLVRGIHGPNAITVVQI